VTGLQVLAAGGMVIAAGLVVLVWALRPAPPSLTGALAQLNIATATTGSPITVPAKDFWSWLPPSVFRLLDKHLGASDADLRILGWTREQLAARKITLALAGLIAPSALTVMFTALHIRVPFVIPAAVGLALAIWLWTLPTAEVKETAAKTRAEFRDALDFFLDLVALERLARGSVPEALEAASEISGCTPFLHIHAALETSALAGQPPWTALRELGEQLDIEQLRNLGDIVAIAADGAAVYKTLLAEGSTLRHATLADARAEANAASERMSIPVAFLTIGLTLFVFIPFILRMFGAA
jgi:hypothetical protein